MAPPRWVIAHLLLTAAFALLPAGLLAIHLRLADGPMPVLGRLWGPPRPMFASLPPLKAFVEQLIASRNA